MLKSVAVFLLSLAWFALVMPWDRFPDPDAFYHAKISLLFWQKGPIAAFPWLDLTTLGSHWSDHHFLFHAIEAPFVAAFGWATGARLTSIALSAVFLTVFCGCARWLGFKRAELWTLALAVTSPLLTRLSLGKASPLALTLFVVGLTAAWKRKPLFVALVGFLFALSHGGWALLLGALFLLCAGEVLHRVIVDDSPLQDAVRASLWQECLAGCAGAVLGTVVHPNFPANISFLWVQVVKIGLGTPFQHVILGREWLPSEPADVVASFAPWIIALILGLGGLVFSAKKPVDRDSARASTSFGWPVAAFLALTFKSRRNAEYLAPALALWIPWMWNMVQPRLLLASLYGQPARWKLFFLAGIAIVVVFALMVRPYRTALSLREGGYPDAIFRSAMEPVSMRANPGDRVFHSDWDEFPVLFNIDDRLRYVAGLDPTFLYEASSTLSDPYRDVTWGSATPTQDAVWDLVHGRLRARFIMVAKEDHQKLLDVVRSDARYTPLTDTHDAATFEILP